MYIDGLKKPIDSLSNIEFQYITTGAQKIHKYKYVTL